MNVNSSADSFFGCRLKFVADISCDINGSIEFLHRSTTIDKPFYQYDPLMESEIADTITNMGVTVLGVDILPTELPVESSRHFGDKLMGVLEELIDVKSKNYESQGILTYALSNGVAHSVITTANGRLTMRYRYLQQLLKTASRTEDERDHEKPLMALRFEGHLFDSGVINRVLDTIEQHGYGVHLDEFVLPKHRPQTRIKSSILLTIVDKEAHGDLIGELETELQEVIANCLEADATMTRVDITRRGKITTSQGPPAPKALVLGSGFVARTALESLARSNIHVTIISNSYEEAAHLASLYDNIDYVVMDVQNEPERLSALIRNASVVVRALLRSCRHK